MFTGEEESFLSYIFRMSFFLKYFAEFFIYEMIDGLISFSFTLFFLSSLFLFLQPLFPLIFFLTVLRDPVEEGAQILGFGFTDSGFTEDSATAHLYETRILCIVLHSWI